MIRTIMMLLVVGGVTAGMFQSAHARNAGQDVAGSTDCTGCHRGQSNPKVTLTLDKTQIAAGAEVIITVGVARTGSNNTAGFSLTSTLGSFSQAPGDTTYAMGTSAAHNRPKTQTSGSEITFKVKWTAPVGQGTVELVAVGIAGNGNRQQASQGTTRLGVAFGCDTAPLPGFVDSDRDGHGDTMYPSTVCKYGAGYAEKGGDCNDSFELANPGAPEICDGVDNDCDVQIDEGLPVVMLYDDDDQDGVGDRAAAKVRGCVGRRYSAKTGDCNDADPNRFPGAPEVCDGADNDCNSLVDDKCMGSLPDGGLSARHDAAPTMPRDGSVPGAPDASTSIITPDAGAAGGSGGGGAAGRGGQAGSAVAGSGGSAPPQAGAGGKAIDDDDGGQRGGCAFGGGGAGGGAGLLALVWAALVVRRRRRG